MSIQHNKQMKKSLIPVIFWALAGVFVVIVSNMLIPGLIPALRGYMAFLMPISWVVFFLLGLTLIILTIKKKVQGLLKKFSLLTGASAVGFLVFVFLHNAVYGLFGVEEPFFFILAVIICPLGFLVGLVGSAILFIKKNRYFNQKLL